MTSADLTSGPSLFEDLAVYEEVAVAVSGGSDSLALLLLLFDWTRERGKKLVAITVDHGLREASKREAALVGDSCRKRGIEHSVLTWQGKKPSSGVSEAARSARYDLMVEHCVSKGIKALVLGHTRDDQAETVFMRLKRTDGDNRGLSGMARQTRFRLKPDHHVMLHRPLLSVSRAALRDFLLCQDVRWIDDPTNEDITYERVRVRRILVDHDGLCDKLVDYAALYGRYRYQISVAVADFLDRYCRTERFGLILVDHIHLKALPKPIALTTMQVLLSVVGGRDHLPSAEKVLDILNLKQVSTLSRVLVSWTNTYLILQREVRDLPLRRVINEEPYLWDQRFWISKKPDVIGGLKVFAGEDFEGDYTAFIDCEAENATKFTKSAFASMPVGRFCDTQAEKDVSTFVIDAKPETLETYVKTSRALGALERYCTGFDFPIETALERLFTVKR